MGGSMNGRTPMVDAHHHYWRVAAQEQSWRTPAHEAIARDYLPDDLRPELDRSGVDATVLVQSVDSPAENDRLATYAEQTPTVAGLVGWLTLHDPPAARVELDRASTPSWSGVRCLVGRHPLDWLGEAATVKLFTDLAERRLAWDVVPVTAEQTAAVLKLANAVPELRIVIDHLARPPVESGGWQPWATQLAELARCPGTALKVSVGIDVLTAWPAWTPSALSPYVGWAIDKFGPHRLMLASNWPVVLLRARYRQAWDGLTAAVRAHGVGGSDLAAVLGGTASRWYDLSRHPTAAPRTHP
jgi:L-fuconolactonase